MHVQKAAGTSVRRMLQAALPPGSLAPRHQEPANFCLFDDFDGLHPEARAVVAVTGAETADLAGHRAVCGHFTLPTLQRLAPPARIATVLREPRTRVLSYYLHLRTSPALRELWSHYGIHRFGAGSPAAFLAEPRVARTSDNRVCRMLLEGDPRIRDGEFIADGDVEAVADAAWARLERLGFVGVVEEPEEAWRGVGALFGVRLDPVRTNVTGEAVVPGSLPAPPLNDARELLERRSAADLIVYRRVVARTRGADGAQRFTDAAFARGLARYDSFTSGGGHGAARRPTLTGSA